jgi:hypothetical protein
MQHDDTKAKANLRVGTVSRVIPQLTLSGHSASLRRLFASDGPAQGGFERNRDLTTVRVPSDGTRMVSSEKRHETNSDVGFDGRLPRLGASCFRSSPHAALAILSGSHASILVPSMGRD